MVSWIWVLLAFFAGGALGVIVYAVCAYDNAKREDTRWWEDEHGGNGRGDD
jgi:phage shock protein PspC (stress-responsive transcriptional regulator)